MNNKELNSENKKELEKKNSRLKKNNINNEKENVNINKSLSEKKKKKKSSINSNKRTSKNANIGSMESDPNIGKELNNNPNNTYILPPPIPKTKKQVKNASEVNNNKDIENLSSLPPSIPLNNSNSPKIKKLGYTTKIKVHNPVREADSVHIIDGSKEIIFKK